MYTKKAMVITITLVTIAVLLAGSSMYLYHNWDNIFGSSPFLTLDPEVKKVNETDNNTVFNVSIRLTAEKKIAKVKIWYTTSDSRTIEMNFDNKGYNGNDNDILEKDQTVYLIEQVKIPRKSSPEWIEIKVNFIDIDNFEHQESAKIFLQDKEGTPGFEMILLLMAIVIILMVRRRKYR